MYVPKWLNYSSTWTVANEQYKWISNPDNGYIDGDVVVFDNANTVKQTIDDDKVRAGDLMYWDFGNDGRIDHASIVVSIEDGDITYAQHTTDKIDGSLRDYLKGHSEARIYVVKIKDSAS